MASTFRFYKPLLPVLLAVWFVSCKHTDYSKNIQQLDSLHIKLSASAERYAQLDVVDLGAKVDSVNRHLDYVQKNYVGYQREDMAYVMGEYRKVKKMIPDIASSHERVKKEIEVSLLQLSSLSQALKEGATHDMAGNKMTEEYLDKAFNTESKKATDLIGQLDALLVRAPRADSIYRATYPKVRFWVDSIPALTKPGLPVPK